MPFCSLRNQPLSEEILSPEFTMSRFITALHIRPNVNINGCEYEFSCSGGLERGERRVAVVSAPEVLGFLSSAAPEEESQMPLSPRF